MGAAWLLAGRMTLRRVFPALLLLAAVIGGLIIGWQVKPTPKLEPVVVLPDSALQQSRPRPPKTFVQKLERTKVKPQQVATSQGKPDTAAVRRYCEPIVVRSAPQTQEVRDTVVQTAVQQSPAPPPLLPPFAGRFHGKRLELHATRSDGSLFRGTYRVHQPVEWGVTDGQPWVTQPRLWVRVGQGAKQCVKQSPIGALVGLAVGALIKKPAVGAIGGAAASCAEGIIETVP